MAEIVEIGKPASEYERRVLRVLREQLPAGYVVFPNVEIGLGQRGFDLDAVVMAPHAFYLLDVRGYAGDIRGDAAQWWLDGDRYLETPLEALERRCHIFEMLLDRVRYKHNVAAGMHVEPLVVLASQRARLLVDDPRASARVVGLADLPRRITDASRLPPDRAVPSLGAHAPLVREFLASQLRPELSHETIGFYHVLLPLEETDDYRAHLARHRFIPNEADVKLKVFQLDPHATDAERAQSMQGIFRDITALKALGEHPAVLGATEIFAWLDDQYVVVSRWRQGRYLAGYLRDAALGQHQRIAVAADVASALAHAHARGVLHRDVRPENVLVDLAGRGALMNFDLARVSHPQVTTLVTPLRGAHHSPYAAPEIAARGMHAASSQSDQYALGAMLYFMLTGEHLALGRPVDYVGPHPRLREAGRSEPPQADVRHVLQTLCAPDPARRFSSTEEAADELRVLSTSWS